MYLLTCDDFDKARCPGVHVCVIVCVRNVPITDQSLRFVACHILMNIWWKTPVTFFSFSANLKVRIEMYLTMNAAAIFVSYETLYFVKYLFIVGSRYSFESLSNVCVGLQKYMVRCQNNGIDERVSGCVDYYFNWLHSIMLCKKERITVVSHAFYKTSVIAVQIY